MSLEGGLTESMTGPRATGAPAFQFLERNLESLRLTAETRQALLGAASRGEVELSADGSPFVRIGGVPLGSPMPASELFAQFSAVREHHVVVVFGLGAGQVPRLTRALCKAPSVVYEPDLGVLRRVLEYGPLDLGGIPIACGTDDLARVWRDFGSRPLDVQVVTTPGYHAAYPEHMRAFVEVIQTLRQGAALSNAEVGSTGTQASVPKEQPIAPPYERSTRAGVFAAVFPEGRVLVEVGRRRSYPGMRSEAPDTRALYRGAAQLFESGARVLDLGAGSGAGARELSQRGLDVTALDVDPIAVQFARAFVPSLHVLRQAAENVPDTPLEAASFDGACVIDVLGQARVPARVLRLARRSLRASGRLFVSEPRAYPSQALQPPVLRAFSPTDLRELLLRTGFEVELALEQTGHFVSFVARPSNDSDWEYLEQAEAALARGQMREAIPAYAHVANASPRLRGEALLGCAAAHVGLGHVDQACALLMDAARLSSASGRALAGLAQVAELAGKHMHALSLAIQALEREPCDRGAVMAMASAAEALGEQDTFGAWRMANCLQPADPVAAIGLARTAADGAELLYAIWVLERLRDFGVEMRAEDHETLSWLYLSAERVGEARLEAEIARVKAPDSAGVAELWAHLDSHPEAP